MKIGLCGTMSVGKTTLVNALMALPEFKGYNFATERSKYLRDLGIPLNTDSTLKGQTVFLAERCAELMHDNLITDRTIIDVIAFTKSAKSINVLDKDELWIDSRVYIRMKKIFPSVTDNLLFYDFFKKWFSDKFGMTPKEVHITNMRSLNDLYNR